MNWSYPDKAKDGTRSGEGGFLRLIAPLPKAKAGCSPLELYSKGKNSEAAARHPVMSDISSVALFDLDPDERADMLFDAFVEVHADWSDLHEEVQRLRTSTTALTEAKDRLEVEAERWSLQYQAISPFGPDLKEEDFWGAYYGRRGMEPKPAPVSSNYTENAEEEDDAEENHEKTLEMAEPRRRKRKKGRTSRNESEDHRGGNEKESVPEKLTRQGLQNAFQTSEIEVKRPSRSDSFSNPRQTAFLSVISQRNEAQSENTKLQDELVDAKHKIRDLKQQLRLQRSSSGEVRSDEKVARKRKLKRAKSTNAVSLSIATDIADAVSHQGKDKSKSKQQIEGLRRSKSNTFAVDRTSTEATNDDFSALLDKKKRSPERGKKPSGGTSKSQQESDPRSKSAVKRSQSYSEKRIKELAKKSVGNDAKGRRKSKDGALEKELQEFSSCRVGL